MNNDYPFIQVGDHYINFRHIIEIVFIDDNLAVIVIGAQRQSDDNVSVSGRIEVYGLKSVARLRTACARWTGLHLSDDDSKIDS